MVGMKRREQPMAPHERFPIVDLLSGDSLDAQALRKLKARQRAHVGTRFAYRIALDDKTGRLERRL